MIRKPLKWYSVALLALTCIIAYDPTRMDNSSDDSISSRYWPVAILKHHTWKLNPFKEEEFKDVAFSALFYGNGVEC